MSAIVTGSNNPSKDEPSRSIYLYGPVLDFLLLGGGSLIALLFIRFSIDPDEAGIAWSLATTLAIANIINHPHFAHSYQIFYRNYFQKLTSDRYAPSLRARYLVAGILAPTALALYMAWVVVGEHPRALGLTANGMFFLVGWHYVKQGYGMAMVDAALKRRFLRRDEKSALLVNSYVCWLFSWALINHIAAKSTGSYWGVEYFVVDIPFWALLVLGAALFLSTSWAASLMLRRRLRGEATAWNGVVAYVVSLYAWLLIRDPIILLWIPAFHSLQYLAVVWRYESNRICAGDWKISPQLRIIFFIALGIGLGYAGFWAAPGWLGENIPYNKEIFGSSLFYFLAWIFINIHHYMLDTVMWRKGNPDVSQYLFGLHH